jgi:hypothetical protein
MNARIDVSIKSPRDGIKAEEEKSEGEKRI